jgi:hypothetical protein
MDIQADRDAAIRKLAELIGEIRIAMLTTTQTWDLELWALAPSSRLCKTIGIWTARDGRPL